jgi:hypothetical protein
MLHLLTTPHSVNMVTFWALPKAVREKIYRLHLVADEQPVDFEAYKKSCGYTENCKDEVIYGYITRYSHPKPAKLKTPQLLQASRRVEREASHIYFGENTFSLSSPESLYIWKRYTWRRHINQIRKVLIDYWTRFKVGAGDEAFKEFGKLPRLESLTFMINETDKVEQMLQPSQYPKDCKSVHRAIKWDESLGFGPQINLQILRLNGMAGLRSLRGLRDVRFLDKNAQVTRVQCREDSLRPRSRKRSCSRGVPKMQRKWKNPELVFGVLTCFPRSRSRKFFRFLDLPPELRSMIYSMHLVFPGPTYPLDGKPVSYTSRVKNVRFSQRDAIPIPRSALDILRVSKQVHAEAHELFYQNDLVFSTPPELSGFLASLSDERLCCLRNLTLFYDDDSLVSVTDGEFVVDGDMGLILPFLRYLKGLRKFHLLLRFRNIDVYEDRLPSDFIDPVDVSRLKDAKALLALRGVTDLTVRDLDLDLAELICQDEMPDNHKNWTEPHYIKTHDVISRQTAALRHFNHGLRLAQTGVVVRELYTEKDWREEVSWPALQGSDCGLYNGCSCGVKRGEAETDKSEPSH